MSDIDVMVPRSGLHVAKKVLESLGYLPSKPGSVEGDVTVSQHLGRLVKPRVTSVELHWNITKPGRRYTIDPAQLWQRAIPIQIGGTALQALAPEDLLLHLCLHTSYQHQFAFGLRPSCDIAQVITHYKGALDWSTIVRRARDWGWERGVYLALRLAQELVGATVPLEILDQLKPVGADDRLVRVAKEQVFTDRIATSDVSTNLAIVLEHRNVWLKGRLLVSSLFLSRSRIAHMYGVDSRSWKIYYYYVLRIRGLLLRNLRVAWMQKSGNREVSEIATRKFILSDWMSRD